MSDNPNDHDNAFYALRHLRRRAGWTSKLTPSTRPTMPKSQWRPLAALCFAIGAAIGALLVGDDGGRTVLVAIVGGLIGVTIGMYGIETIWERRRARVLGGSPRA